MTTRLRVDLLSRGEETSFEFLDGRPGSTDRFTSPGKVFEQPLSVDR
jgi:hypothetical protein